MDADSRERDRVPVSGSHRGGRMRVLMLRALMPKDPVRGIYGLILVGALMAAESYRPESHLDALASVLLTLSVYWLAESYSATLGERVHRGEPLTLRSLRRGLAHGLSVVRGATLPVLALLVGWVVGASPQASITAAVWSTVGALVALELLAGVRAKAGAFELLLDCCVGATLGASVLALRALLH